MHDAYGGFGGQHPGRPGVWRSGSNAAVRFLLSEVLAGRQAASRRSEGRQCPVLSAHHGTCLLPPVLHAYAVSNPQARCQGVTTRSTPVSLIAGTSSVSRAGQGWALEGDQNCESLHKKKEQGVLQLVRAANDLSRLAYACPQRPFSTLCTQPGRNELQQGLSTLDQQYSRTAQVSGSKR